MASKKQISNGAKPPKTPEQLGAGAAASALYRANKRAKRIPEGTVIDRETAKLLLSLVRRDGGLYLAPERLGAFRDRLIRINAWDDTKDVRSAVDGHLKFLIEQ